jgi:glycosyltransferase involved in cell wall biosynthesis
MRIAVDARAAEEVPAGRGRYVRELLRAFAALPDDHEYVLMARTAWNEGALDERFRWRLIGRRDPLWSLAAARASSGADAVLATNSYLLAAASPAPAVTTVHDLVAFERELRLPRGSAAERLTLPLAVRRGRTLLCVSEATRAALVERFPRAAPHARVVPHGVEERFFGDGSKQERVFADGPKRPYVLMTGTLEPRKNIVRAVEAFAGLPPDLGDAFELVLAGPRGWETGEIDAALGRHGERVRRLGHVDDAELPALYAGATAFLYPSLREGFGLPVLEAMAAGTAVVTSGISSLPEVGGDAVRYVDPYDVSSIRDGLAEVLGDAGRREALAAAGRERARSFTWERTARETLAVLSER